MTTVIGRVRARRYRQFMTLPEQTLADIVTTDTRAAVVFDRMGLDYCCQGQQTLAEAARQHGVPLTEVVSQLEVLGPRQAGDSVDDWPALDDLTRHIVTTHHAYVRQSVPQIAGWLTRLIERHGARHPELVEVEATFRRLADDMGAHMLKEENILFPFVDALARAVRTGGRLPASPFGTILNPIRMMEADHQESGGDLAHLRALTGGFRAPADGCTTYRACYAELERFEADLHRHVHLENHILFPRAIALEAELA
jgi:regulator of cell morphogenesis and NO signaling